MSSNIVAFTPKTPPRLIWACNCGCTSQYAHESGALECAGCGVFADGISGGWREHLPGPDHASEAVECFKVLPFESPEFFLRRHMKKSGDLAAVLIVSKEGTASTWRDGSEQDGYDDWLRGHLTSAVERIVVKGAP